MRSQPCGYQCFTTVTLGSPGMLGTGMASGRSVLRRGSAPTWMASRRPERRLLPPPAMNCTLATVTGSTHGLITFQAALKMDGVEEPSRLERSDSAPAAS